MPDVVLDTTVFIDTQNGSLAATRLLDRIQRSSTRLFYNSITVFELWLRKMSKAEESQHADLLAICTETPLDNRAARIMATWLSGQPCSGRRHMLGDAMIAATAASLRATCYTRNPRDFMRFYTDVQSY
jgi:predicted nucleic acid-binding protein